MIPSTCNINLEEISTPFFIYKPERIKKKVEFFLNYFSGETLYAVKTNPSKFVLKTIYKCGIKSFDVASLTEIKLIKSLFNNSIIIKEGNFIQAINLTNGNTFWQISDKKISKKSKIVNVRNYKTNIEIFLSNGDLLTINNKKLKNITDLNTGKINAVTFEKENIIVYSKNNKIIIF